MKNLYLSGTALLLASIAPASAETSWEYRVINDGFTDKTHHVATVNNLSLSPSEEFRAGFECRNGKQFVFTVRANRNLGGRNKPFKLDYRADDKRVKSVKMRTFTNSESGGLNRIRAIDVANDFLNAERLRVRMITKNGDQFSTELSVENAAPSILQAVQACGLTVGQ